LTKREKLLAFSGQVGETVEDHQPRGVTRDDLVQNLVVVDICSSHPCQQSSRLESAA
jgi:hypothetical protein